MSAKAGEAIAVVPKEGNPESKSSGFRVKRERTKKSTLRDGETALSKSCANDIAFSSFLPFCDGRRRKATI